MNAGQAIIDAVIRAAGVQDAVHPTNDSTIFIWSANAAEQIEAALAEAGYKLKETAPQSVTELASEHPALLEYIKGMEDQIARLSFHYGLMRDKLVQDGARELYGGRQAAANYTPMAKCIEETSRRLYFDCPCCAGTGAINNGGPPDQCLDACAVCEGEGIITIPELP